MITRIFADNFRCFSSFTFEPKQLNLLVGENGSGKSTVLDVVATLRLLATRTDALTMVPFATSLTRWSSSSEQRLGLTLSDVGGGIFDWEAVLGTRSTGDSVEVVAETIRKDSAIIAERDGKSVRVRGQDLPVPYRLDASLLALRFDDPDLNALRQAVEHLLVLRIDLNQIERTSTKESTGIRIDGQNFPSNYRHVCQSRFEETRRLHVALEGVLGGFRSLELEDVGEDAKVLVVKLFAESGKPDFRLAFHELSEGQRSLIVLYHVLTTFDLRKRSLLIDEPDNFLSLRELQPWLQTLTRAAEDDGLQALIASHNPEVIDYLAAENAWLFERDEAGPSRVRPLPIDRSSGMKASEQLARGWTLGT
jgi:energy-coupling factor transporter ATP-binding protein EcfA2